MNYHIFPDDKFFDSLIEDFEKVCGPNMNRYFIRAAKENGKYVKSLKAEWISDIYDPGFLQILNSVKADNKIFIHWYDIHIGKLMLTLDKNIPIYTSIMGGDFYEEPFLHHINWLCDKKTLNFLNKKLLYPPVWGRRPWKLAKQLLDINKIKKEAKKLLEIKKETINRINYLIVGENMVADYKKVIKIYRPTSAKHLPFIYNQNFDLALSLGVIQKFGKCVNVQIGNSATYMNNHLDVLDKLKKFSNEDVNFTLPLSYGNKEYAEFVKDQYFDFFGPKVNFMEEFISREDYVIKLQQIDIGIMYHNRSQALGNCVTLLTLGKKLYMKRKNPLWDMFNRIGVIIFDADKLDKISFDEFKKPLTAEQVSSNIQKLSFSFSEKKRLENIAKLVN